MKSKNGSRYLPCLSGLQEVAFDSTRKRTTFLAESEGSKALVSIEAKPVSKLDLEKVQEDPTSSSLELIHSNDRWSSYSSSNMKIDITLPATEREISAASSKDFERLVCEPPQLYVSKIRPFIESSPEHQPPLWIKNILNGTSEQDRIIFKNEEFVILPDSKWCGKDRRSLYLLVLFTDGSLRTIRDLSTDRHLALLKELKSILKEVLACKYDIDISQVRPYFHYLPSFYLLHLHVPHISMSYAGAVAGRAHLLDDIIDNMENVSLQFYSEKKSLFYAVNSVSDRAFFSLFQK